MEEMEQGRLLQQAEGLARQLAQRGVDPNEVGKALAYLRKHRDAGSLFPWLQAVRSSPFAGRSGRTPSYLDAMLAVLRPALQPLTPEQALWVLGWAFRLLRYYYPKERARQLGFKRYPG